jgi:restriction system protein
MPIPTMHVFYFPLLVAFSKGAHNARTALPALQHHFGFTDEEMQELIPSGTRERVFDRADWAIFHLMKAGLVERTQRGVYALSEAGKTVLAGPDKTLDRARLESFAAYQAFLAEPKGTQTDGSAIVVNQALTEVLQTPEDAMASAQGMLDAALRDDILLILKDINPVRFERLILDLLSAMGYGGGDLSKAMMTKTSGDGGIDGIIHEDALGLDAVYIQAKRNAPDNKVGRPTIQQFVGSLNGEGATKGVFVTTSDFSAEAKGFLGKVQHRIVLINGQELARLMIRYGVGVRARATYVIKGVDEDYFADLNAG